MVMKTTAPELAALDEVKRIAAMGGAPLTRQQFDGINEVCNRLTEIKAEIYDIAAWMQSTGIGGGAAGLKAMCKALDIGDGLTAIQGLLVMRQVATLRRFQPESMRKAA